VTTTSHRGLGAAGHGDGGQPEKDWLVDLFRRMLLIRAFDSTLPDLYTQGLVRGSAHAAIGQEAVAVGGCAALRPDDYITSTHRGHGHAIAKGADLNRMMAELLGRADGVCRGKGGSMHIADFSIGMLGANGIVGGGIGMAAGAALSALLRGSGQVALCFFGDGAINQGAFHEVSNLAAIWKLPLVLLCENNQFAMSARVTEMTSVDDLAGRASAYGFPGRAVDGMDVLVVHAAVVEAAERARSGSGPSLVVADCYRFAGHFSGDLMRYRSRDEAAPWLARDPVVEFRAELIKDGVISAEEAESLAGTASLAVSTAIEFAKESPLPDPDSVRDDLYG
jgi:TPP-dependent pyruvate/acetoin dehydrogenase alpha subunit